MSVVTTRVQIPVNIGGSREKPFVVGAALLCIQFAVAPRFEPLFAMFDSENTECSRRADTPGKT